MVMVPESSLRGKDVMKLRTAAVVTVVLAAAGSAPAGDRWFRSRLAGPGPGWTYYGLDTTPYVTAPPCTGTCSA